FLTGIFILSAERQPIKLAWRKIVWLPLCVACYIKCVKLFLQRTNTNRLEIVDNDISISLFTVSR
ncbi:hypothetical protein F3F27_29340, partial [Bacteroides ovatus]